MIRLTVGRNGNVKKQQLKPQSALKKPLPKEPPAPISAPSQPNLKPKKPEVKPKKEVVQEYEIPEEEYVFECKTPAMSKQELRSRMSSADFKAQQVSPAADISSKPPKPNKPATPATPVRELILEEHRNTGSAHTTASRSTKESTPAPDPEDIIPVEVVLVKVYLDECIQTVEIVDDMPLRYRNKAEALNRELIEMKEKHEKDVGEMVLKHAKEFERKETIEAAAMAQRSLADEEMHARQVASLHRIEEIQHNCNTAESSKHALAEQIKTQRESIQEKEEQLHTAHSEKMETFKQFRALNRLYEELKESAESVEAKRNHLIHHSKELEVRCGEYARDQKVMGEKLRVATDELSVSKRAYEEVKLEKTKLRIEKNNYQKEIEYTRTLLEAQRHKVMTAQETIESLMRFPDTSLGEDDNQISLSSPKFDQLVQEYVKGNCLRILVLETKNEEYRALRMQHAEVYAKQNPREMNIELAIPQLLFSPVNISDTLAMVEQPLETVRRVSDMGSRPLDSIKSRSLDRIISRDRVAFASPKGSMQDMATEIHALLPTTPEIAPGLVRRSSMSGGKRGIGLSKNVSWHNDDF